MKRCPKCSQTYTDETLNFCLEDGEWLVGAESDGPATAVLPSEASTRMHSTPTSPPTRAGATISSKPKYILGGLIGALFLSALGIGGYWLYPNWPGDRIDSIAVLPFENRSGSSDADYLSDGIADSLIYRLTQLPNLKVSPTSSVMRYKGKHADVGQIAQELTVDAVLSGRLVQMGDSLNISVQLIDARTSKLIWAEQYDRKMSDLLATQREIATAIADKLQLKLVGDQARGITKKYTNSNEAYDLYMKARHHFAKRTKEDMLKAADYYRQSIAIDPNFALAYARIAEVYQNLPTYGYLSPDEALPPSRAAVQKALELDPTLSEVHAFNGFNLAGYEHKWADAEREFKRAIELDPNSSAAHFRYGQMYLLPTGQFEKSIAETKIALDTEPFDIVFGGTHAWAYFAAGQNDSALDLMKKAYDLEATHPSGRYFMAMVYNGTGMYSEALEICETGLQTDPSSERMLAQAGIAYARLGQHEKARETAKRLENLEKTQYVSPYGRAAIQVALGDNDKAFALLDRSFQVHDWWLHRLKVDPQFAPLRDDPRYTAMLRRLNFSE